ncbi:hypothetical protein B4127_3034 [Bacillus pumilus]|uniref:Uncharacterized protein n=1 Tax=Bacillus pumilus TaxID=1408 RepID=A0AB34QY53_BACPU|nr:hypothetical protein B4127_3034 [Bacillus pumilus]
MLVFLNSSRILFKFISDHHIFILSVFHCYVLIFLDFSWY